MILPTLGRQRAGQHLQRGRQDLRLWNEQTAGRHLPEHRDFHRHPPVHGT